MTHIPMPGEIHPAYADQATHLQSWLAGAGPPYVQVPVLHRPSIHWSAPADEKVSAEPVVAGCTITRRTCFGPAPYVGRPFGYTWPDGVDELGRCVAGDAEHAWL